MGKHILTCECGRKHDISELFGSAVMDWVEENKEEPHLFVEDDIIARNDVEEIRRKKLNG